MTRGNRTTPRSPVLVAVMAFGAAVLIPMIIAIILYGTGERAHDIGNVAGVIGVVAAAVAYVVQQRRISKRE